MTEKADVSKMTYEVLRAAVRGDDVAIRATQRLEPAGGDGDKVFPPTYEGARYAEETRRVDGVERKTVLLDSVQSQANRMELALRNAYDRGELEMPLVLASFGNEFPHVQRVTALDAPHRISDAIFRDCTLSGVRFRDSEVGKSFTGASVRDATGLFEACPTALVFGMWDSTGPLGGLGAKFPRALVSEIVGVGWTSGVKTSSRIDPLQIAAGVPVYAHADDRWTVDATEASRDKKGDAQVYGEKGKASEINHGNVTPSIQTDERSKEPIAGGGTIEYAVQHTVLSLSGLRRLTFPLGGVAKHSDAPRTVLAALAIHAVVLQRREGYDLRSRCVLRPTSSLRVEVVGANGEPPRGYALDANVTLAVLREAVKELRGAGYRWATEPVELTPSKKLLDLIRKSVELTAAKSKA